MFLAAAVVATLAECVPMRWISAAPESLDLLDGSPVNCLLLEEEQWAPRLVAEAKKRGLAALAVVREPRQVEKALSLPMAGYVLEGDFERKFADAFRTQARKPVAELPGRRGIRLDSSDPVVGTRQGVWPGLEVEHGGPKTSNSAPTGAFWIHTNTGFLRYMTAAAKAVFWMGNRAPEGVTYPASRYAQVIADANAVGARWVIALDAAFRRRLLEREADALAGWKRIMAHVSFYEEHAEWRTWRARGDVAIVQDSGSGALISGNLVDMLAVMNTPVRPVHSRELTAATLEGAEVTVTVDPRAYSPEQRALIAKFAAGGGKVVRGPEGWKMPVVEGDRITFDRKQYRDLEAIWPELHLAVQRKNFGVRLFNVSGALSYLQASPDGRRVVLHLINYTDYEVESITAFVQGKYSRAVLYQPGAAPKELALYETPEGAGVEIDKLGVCGAVVLE